MAALELGRRGNRGLGLRFRAQLASTGLANLGDGLLGTAVPLLAISLTRSPAQISLLSAAAWLPWLLLGVGAGVIIDRVDRRKAQIAALLARSLLLAVGAALAASGILTMPLLVAVVLGYSVTEVFADLGATSIVPDLVPSERLSAANGHVIGVQQVANSFLGGPLAGGLVLVGAGISLGLPAVLAVLAALVLGVGLKGTFRPQAPAAESRGAWNEVRDGLAFLFHHPVIRPLVLASSVLNLASAAYFAVFVLWTVGSGSAMGLTESQFPLLMLGFAAGAVAGSLVAERILLRLGERATILIAFTADSILLLVPVFWPNGWVVLVTLGIVGVTNTIGNVVSQSVRQRLVPGGLLGRVGGATRTLAYGLMPLGAVVGGLLGEAFGLPVTFIAAVAVSLAACAWLAGALRNGTEMTPDLPERPKSARTE